MIKNRLPLAAIVGMAILTSAFFAYRHWRSSDLLFSRADILAQMPVDANAVLFVDLGQLRSSPFLAQLLDWAPQPSPDSDYAQFLQATGFDYERDLDRLALAVNRQPQSIAAFAVAEGRFDRKKIESYAAQFGSLKTADGKTLYAIPMKGSARKAFFVFLRDNRIAWANDSEFFQRPSGASSKEWQEHFSRLAGTPLFAVLRQDSGAASALAQAPGGLRSPQLAALIGQLQWISIGGKPDRNLLRVVLEGECLTENTVHQLKEMLGGIVVLAQGGLSETKTRKQLDPQLREGYLELLQSVEIQQLDRGSSKSVRVIFDVTPKLLQSAKSASSAADPPSAAHAQRDEQVSESKGKRTR
jgi:hypothetical protein